MERKIIKTCFGVPDCNPCQDGEKNNKNMFRGFLAEFPAKMERKTIKICVWVPILDSSSDVSEWQSLGLSHGLTPVFLEQEETLP